MLRKISFHGFKSFADPVEVDFSDGITAVIGPNGCGKSNIFDGIRWVLGETSAKSLRGGNMKDVIFSGCDTRKAKEFAEVTLVLDNMSGVFQGYGPTLISVSRKAYRSGKSEYFINDTPARLKDVQELFMDTGIGSNSYSMIGQEQTKKLLSTKLEERRAIFEEAAGIVKLKQQRVSTEKKLTEVTDNLTRMNDILTEIEKQLSPLRKQADKAEKHKELSDHLTSIEIQFLLHEHDRLERALQEHIGSQVTLEETLHHLSTNLLNTEEELEELKEGFKQQNEHIFDGQSETASLKKEVERLNGLIELTKERFTHSEKQIEDVQNQLKEIEKTYSLSTDDFKNKQLRTSEIEGELNVLESKRADIITLVARLEADRLELKTDIEMARTRSTELYNQLTRLSVEYDQWNKKEEAANLLLHELSQQKSEKTSTYLQIQHKKERMESELIHLQQEREARRESMVATSEQVDTLKTSLAQMNQELLPKENEYIRKKSRLESLEQLVENHDGYFEGVKNVLRASKNQHLNGILGPVASLLTVHKGYERAIDTLLQSSSQHIVVDTETNAKKAISYLKEHRLGRATFLPIDMATPSSPSGEELKKIQTQQGLASALDFVTYSESLAPIVKSLLGRSLVGESLDIASSFSKKTGTSLRIATLDGDLVQRGAMTGGASKNQRSGFFSRQGEVKTLKHDVSRLHSDIEATKKEIEVQTKRLDSMESTLSTQSQDLDLATEREMDHLRKVDDAKHEHQRALETKEGIDIQIKEAEFSMADSKKQSASISYELKDKKHKHKQETEKLEQNVTEEEKVSRTLSATHEEKTTLMLDIQRLREELKTLEDFFESFTEGNHTIEEKILYLHEKRETEQNRIISYKKDLATYEESFQAHSRVLEEQDAMIDKLRKENQEINDSISRYETTIKQLRKEKETMEKDSQKIQLSISRLETEKSHIVARLEETYEVTEGQLSNFTRETIDHSQSKTQIEQLKKDLAKLGNINHNAPEEFAALQDRYTDEKRLYDDVLMAKNDLSSLMESVLQEMTERFTSTFSSIATHFEKTFVDLFGGGKARLSLQDPKHPLDSAIDIMAQPPGKKPLSIDILSGGEKNFTAVALIFAILSAKPSPFVYLDEVDAPLDDANVARYAYYLKKFSDKAQFIVVTHRKGTMQVSDFIYGVTQEELGVTIIFPHKLEDQQKSG